MPLALPLYSRIHVPEYVPYLSNNIFSIKMPPLMPKGFSANLVLLRGLPLGL